MGMAAVANRRIWVLAVTIFLLLSGCAGYEQSQKHEMKSKELESLATKYYQAGRFKEAADTYTAAIDEYYDAEHACWAGRDCDLNLHSAHTTLRILYTRAGWAKYRAGNREAAIRDLEHSVNKYPDVRYPPSWYLLGLLYHEAGNRAGALRAYNELKNRDATLASKLLKHLQQ